MKTDAAATNPTFYPDTAAAQAARSSPPPLPSPAGRASRNDGRGPMAAQLRDALSEASMPRAEIAANQSPTASVRTNDSATLRPVTMSAYNDAVADIRQKALDYLDDDETLSERQAELRSWGSERKYKDVQDAFEKPWENAMEHAGLWKLSSEELDPDEQVQAEKAKDQMTQEVGDHVLAQLKNEGWIFGIHPQGLTWLSQSPFMLIKNCPFDQLDEVGIIKQGEQGKISFLSAALVQGAAGEPATAEFALKTPQGDGWLDAHREVGAYVKIIDDVGPHPNLMVPVGQVSLDTSEGLMLRKVPGSAGGAFLNRLHRDRQDQTISESEFEEVLALLLETGLEVIDHCRRASICAHDRKPDNFIVNQETGAPVFGDLGLSSEEGGPAGGSTKRYASPEVHDLNVDHRSDMVGLVASLADAVGGGGLMYRHSAEGKVNVMPNLVDADEQDGIATIRHPADDPKTPFWQLAARILYKDIDGKRLTHRNDRLQLAPALAEIRSLRQSHDQERVLALMKRLSRDAAAPAASTTEATSTPQPAV